VAVAVRSCPTAPLTYLGEGVDEARHKQHLPTQTAHTHHTIITGRAPQTVRPTDMTKLNPDPRP
jgi:hypothetical protein